MRWPSVFHFSYMILHSIVVVRTIPDVLSAVLDSSSSSSSVSPASSQNTIEDHISNELPPEYNTLVDSTAPSAKLCFVKRWPDFKGYGFSLKSVKGEVGQRIGEVDPLSPSAHVDLHDGDRIFKVNGISVVGASHAEVVAKIQMNANEVEMLVADREAELFYEERDLDIGSNANVPVKFYECPDYRPGEGWYAM